MFEIILQTCMGFIHDFLFPLNLFFQTDMIFWYTSAMTKNVIHIIATNGIMTTMQKASLNVIFMKTPVPTQQQLSARQ